MDVLARCSVSELSTRHLAFADDLSLYQQRGWGGVNVWLHKLEDPPFATGYMPEAIVSGETLGAARSAIDARGLAVPAVVVSGGFTLPGVRRQRIDHALSSIAAAKALGSSTLVIVPGPRLDRPFSEVLSLAASAIREVLERSVDTRLAVEPLRVEQVDFINTLDEALELVECVDDARFGIQADTWHLWRDAELTAAIVRAGDRIFGLDICDASGPDDNHMQRLVPGSGVVPLREIVDAFHEAGYRGWFTLECDPADLPTSEYGALLDRAAAGMNELLASVLSRE
jgi:sugar phosphate isomerase/epimerase